MMTALFNMKNQNLFLLIFFCFISSSLFAEKSISYCYIKDHHCHRYNQKLLAKAIDQELALFEWKDPNQQAAHLSSRITQIARKLLDNRFLTNAYAVPEYGKNLVSFQCFPLWEGKTHSTHPIPITFFVYVWPSEKAALKYGRDPRNHYYASSIHSHPIPCALAVLKGTLTQKNFALVNNCIQFCHEDVFNVCEGEVDDLKQPFIHQLCNKQLDEKSCLSLHAYGLDSAEKVMDCFQKTQSTHTFGYDVRLD